MPTYECRYNRGSFCQTGNETPGCFLIREFSNQSACGGLQGPDRNAKAAGPYWPETNWLRYVARLAKIGDRDCPFNNDLQTLIEEITSSKTKAGEIFKER